MSTAAVLGVLTAALFATGVTISRLGMRTLDTTTGVYWSVLATTTVLGTLVLIRGGLGTLTLQAFILVGTGGILASVVGRFSSFRGALRLGPSRSVAVQSSTYPVMSVVGGLLVFRESLSPARLLGVALLMLSVRAVFVDLRSPAVDPKPESKPVTRLRIGLPGRLAILYPLASGAAYGASDLFRKGALEVGADPLGAAFAGIAVALVIWTTIVGRKFGVRALVRVGVGARWYMLSGAFSALAVLSSFYALQQGDASVVGPLIATQPVFVAAASALLLGDLEKRTIRTFLAIGLVTVGAVVLGRFG